MIVEESADPAEPVVIVHETTVPVEESQLEALQRENEELKAKLNK